ncbi:MAG: FliM/FliN family flagellar motor switch protein [Alphaproteobacteria bacterium]
MPQSNAVETVDLEISVVIGTAVMPIHQLLRMGRGALIELDARVDDYAWIYANNRLIARGEIVVNGETVSVQIKETLSGSNGER